MGLSSAYVIGPSLVTTIIEEFEDQGQGYKFSCLLFIAFSVIGIIVAIIILLRDEFDIFDKNFMKI